MPEVRAPLVCPECLSKNVTAVDVARRSQFAPDLLVTPYRCECGNVFFSVKAESPPPSEPPAPWRDA